MNQAVVRRALLGLAVALVAGAVAAGLMVVGSPATERVRRLDDRRVNDLADITRALNSYWTRSNRLPSSLDELFQSPGAPAHSHDPNTQAPYGYRLLGAKSYELCADFQAESATDPHGVTDRFWSHRTGRQCFRLEAEENRR